MSPSPTRIATAEELDALPPGTVIRDDEGTGYAVNSSAGTWGAAGTGGLWGSSTILLVMHAPFTVLHDPVAPPVSDAAAARAVEVAVREVVWNASNHPVPHAVLGRDVSVLSRKVTDAVLAALGLPVTDKADQ